MESKLPADIVAPSALRGKIYIAKEHLFKNTYPERLLSTPQGTITRDRYDVSDSLFINLLDTDKVFIGTIMEMAWADSRRIPIILVMEAEIFTIMLSCDKLEGRTGGGIYDLVEFAIYRQPCRRFGDLDLDVGQPLLRDVLATVASASLLGVLSGASTSIRLTGKLGARSRVDAVAIAVRAGLVMV